MKHFGSLIVFLALAFSAAALGAFFPPGEWYATLNKPSWTPPGWLFGPVWSVLYVMIAVSGWRLWTRRQSASDPALIFWAIQMVLNALWSWLYFGLHRPDLSLIDISLLWLAIAATITFAWPRDRWAAGLLVPYLLWVSFATALNFAIWRLNPGL